MPLHVPSSLWYKWRSERSPDPNPFSTHLTHTHTPSPATFKIPQPLSKPSCLSKTNIMSEMSTEEYEELFGEMVDIPNSNDKMFFVEKYTGPIVPSDDQSLAPPTSEATAFGDQEPNHSPMLSPSEVAGFGEPQSSTPPTDEAVDVNPAVLSRTDSGVAFEPGSPFFLDFPPSSILPPPCSVSSNSIHPEIPMLTSQQVYFEYETLKTRAETEFKVHLVLDIDGSNFDKIHFPRKAISKAKQLAGMEEKADVTGEVNVVRMDTYLVCASAMAYPLLFGQALRRARGEEEEPQRDADVEVSALPRAHPGHPQNGGQVRICKRCQTREHNRVSRRKPGYVQTAMEKVWHEYDHDRVIIINALEYTALQRPDIPGFGESAREVKFSMRIACYCRHQQEDAQSGFQVIFTFKNSEGAVLAQEVSRPFQISDDHKKVR
jgi:hypothetical protein